MRSAWHRRHLITGGAVLEYGPTEILSPVSPMLPRPVCLCRPRRSSRLGRRGKPWLLDLERRIPARDRFAPDSPLEGGGFEPSVPRLRWSSVQLSWRRATRPMPPRNADRSRQRVRRAISACPAPLSHGQKPASSSRSASATSNIWRRLFRLLGNVGNLSGRSDLSPERMPNSGRKRTSHQ
ncbi:MAG: hypothetical protein QOG78_818 [Rhodospirillaceae bacterium]|nr:hypothetical protein [Rhodospirillaceae bacterium]